MAEIMSSFFKWQSCLYRGVVDPIQEIDVGHPLCLGSFLEKLARVWGGRLGRTATLFSSWSWSEIDVEIGGSLERTSTLLSSIESEIDMGHLP